MKPPSRPTLLLRYGRFVQSLPTFCGPLVPTGVKILTFASLALINVFWPALTVGFWPALIVGLVLLALAPQWESCIFGLMDLMSCLALSIGGVLGLARALTG